ncbi:hypothetical protein BLA29_015041, partial [Euroglyphus maynei]
AADSSAKVNGQTSSWLSDSPSSSSLLWPANDMNKPNNPKTGPSGAGSMAGIPPTSSNWMDPSASIDTGNWTAQNSLLQNRIVGASSGSSGGNGGGAGLIN